MKHKFIKELINKRKNKKGQISFFLIFLILGMLVCVIMILVGGIAVVKINTALSEDVQIGQVNLKNVTADTIGKYTNMYLGSADWWGVSVIMGMILGLFASAFFTRNSFPKWGIIIDIFIIITMFILSLYVSSTYSQLLDALAEAGETFLEDYTPKTSLFMINLPIFITIVGVFSMILFHSFIPKQKEEQIYQTGGYLQGI